MTRLGSRNQHDRGMGPSASRPRNEGRYYLTSTLQSHEMCCVGDCSTFGGQHEKPEHPDPGWRESILQVFEWSQTCELLSLLLEHMDSDTATCVKCACACDSQFEKNYEWEGIINRF